MLIKESQKMPLSIEIKTLHGKAASVDGLPAWACSDEFVGKLDVAPDGMSATFNSVNAGVCAVTVTVDADLGAGVSPIIGSLDVQVVGEEAAIVTITAGAPVDV